MRQYGPMNQVDQLRAFVLEHRDRWFVAVGGLGSPPARPGGINAHQYLRFAERALVALAEQPQEDERQQRAIECITHLKRAVECQADALIEHLGLTPASTKENWKVPKKLDFVRRTGVFEGRALRRLNKRRNEVEHDFTAPDIDYLDAYYDLVLAFAHVVETAMMGGFGRDLDMQAGHEFAPGTHYLRLTYDSAALEISAEWFEHSMTNKRERLVCRAADFDDYVDLLRLMYVLGRTDSHDIRERMGDLVARCRSAPAPDVHWRTASS